MDPYSLEYKEFSRLKPWPFTRVPDVGALNQRIAGQLTDALRNADRETRQLIVICPVGPLDYSHWVEQMNREQTNGDCLVTLAMDEYVGEDGAWIEEDHPLSFRNYLHSQLFRKLEGRARVPAENIHFPDPSDLEASTALVERHGGADLLYGGLGLNGHLAFNDPPEPGDLHAEPQRLRDSRTRVVTISRESQAQMCIGGTAGNWDILPKRAVTLGMYELLLSKRIHLTFMRSWHSGVLRRALFGPVSASCPGSLVQDHPNVEVTLTDLVAQVPMIHAAQSITL